MIITKVKGKIKQGIKKINNWFGTSHSPRSRKSIAAQKTSSIFSEFAGAILSSLIAAWISQDVLRYTFPLYVVFLFALFFFLTLLIQIRWLNVKPNAYFIFTTMLSIIIIEGILLAFLYVTTRPPTTYLIVDASENTIQNFPEILQNLVFASETQPERSLSGLRIYGGNISGSTGCNSTSQLIKPIPLKDYKNELGEIIAKLQPQGRASLTIAVLRAIKDDLSNTRGPISLLVITSGIDDECEPPSGGIFEEIAQDIKKNTRNDIKIVIISVGKLPEGEQTILNNYAKAFNGVYLNAESPGSLSLLITAPKSYFINYQNRNQPTIVPKQ